jgi:hypothetical protein
MAGTGVGKFSSTASNNTSNLTVNFAENMAPSNVNNAARELMGHMRDMYEQLGDGYFEFGDGDGEYTVTRGDADTITITGTGDITSVYYVGRKIRITDGEGNVVEGVISGSSHSSTTQTIDLSGITLASGAPTKVELGIDTAAFGGKIILDDDGDTYIEAPTDDTIDIYVAGAKDFSFTANTFTAHAGSNVDLDGDLDVDGTTNLDVVDIDGAVNMATTALVTGVLTTTATAVFNGGFTSNDGVTISTADVNPQLTIISTEAGGDQAPLIDLYRNSSTPADGDVLGQINYYGENSADEKITYVRTRAGISDVTDGDEGSTYTITSYTAGSQYGRLNIQETETVFNENSADLDFRVESNDNANMFVVDGGANKVGIGNAAPANTLDISDTAATDKSLRLGQSGGTENANATIAISSGGTGNAMIRFDYEGTDTDRARIGVTTSGQALQFFTAGDNERMRIDNAGKVGIGTATPQTTLHVEGTAPIIRISDSNSASEDEAVSKIQFYDRNNTDLNAEIISGTGSSADFIISAHNNRALIFQTNANAERMRILSSGFVGIGTDAPDYIFQVDQTDEVYSTSIRNRHASNPYGLFVKYTSSGPDGAGNHFLLCQDNSTTRMQVASNGNVTNHDNSYGAISDERIKQDIRDSNSQWNDIKAVKVRNYKKKDDVRQYGDNAWEQIGVVAQELEAVSPKLIKHNDPSAGDILSSSEFGTLYTADDAETQDALYTSDDQEVIDGGKNVGDIKTPSTKQIGEVKTITEQVKSVNYSVLYMKAIKALQEAMTRIETLETKVAALEE